MSDKRKRNKEYDATYLRRWRSANPERTRAIEKRHYEKRKIEINARRRARYATDPERRLSHKLGNLTWHYGIAKDQYLQLLNEQHGLCAICKKTPEARGLKRKLGVDHDHETDRIRGLLCQSCNVALGLAEDNPELLRSMAAYLENWNASLFRAKT